MLVHNNVTSPRFTALRIDDVAQTNLENMPVERLLNIMEVGKEFKGYDHADMYIYGDAKTGSCNGVRRLYN